MNLRKLNIYRPELSVEIYLFWAVFTFAFSDLTKYWFIYQSYSKMKEKPHLQTKYLTNSTRLRIMYNYIVREFLKIISLEILECLHSFPLSVLRTRHFAIFFFKLMLIANCDPNVNVESAFRFPCSYYLEMCAIYLAQTHKKRIFLFPSELLWTVWKIIIISCKQWIVSIKTDRQSFIFLNFIFEVLTKFCSLQCLLSLKSHLKFSFDNFEKKIL